MNVFQIITSVHTHYSDARIAIVNNGKSVGEKKSKPWSWNPSLPRELASVIKKHNVLGFWKPEIGVGSRFQELHSCAL